MRNIKSITDERLKEIAAIIPVPDDDSPEITEAEAARALFAHVLEALKAEGKGYQTRINKILRDAVLGA